MRGRPSHAIISPTTQTHDLRRSTCHLGKSLYRSGEFDEAYDVLILVIEKKIERYIREAGNYCINIACNHFVDDQKIIDICTILLDEFLELMDSSKNGHVPVTQLVLALSRQEHFEQAISILQRHRGLYRNSSEFALVKAQIHLNAGETQLYFEAVQSAFSSVKPGAQILIPPINTRNSLSILFGHQHLTQRPLLW